jgi:cytochrome c oxidase subunit 1
VSGAAELAWAERREAEASALLERTWGDAPGLWGWITTIDHKRIARRYLVTCFLMFTLAGVNALIMRLQLARPLGHVVGPDLYNQLFTVHGTTMMFLFAVPVMQAMGLYFVPLMVGTRDVSFPRLNALGYWTFVFGCMLLWFSFLGGAGPDAGWFAYTPLSGPQFGAGKRSDVWAQTITFSEIAAIIGAIVTITTAFKQRAPGMNLARVPLFVWAMVVASFMVLLAMPTIAAASLMLALDRLVGTQFFNQAEGGDPLLWQHLYWFFAHPEVYILFLPATGMVSTMLPSFTRRPVVGYPFVVASLVTTGIVSFALWVHHMFMTGVEHLSGSLFSAASMMIAIPSGAQVFCWIATIWSAREIRWRVPMYFILGSIFVFVCGGLTGVMVASMPLDSQMHDSHFVVAHLHYVIIGGSLFPLYGALHYWFTKLTGRMTDERLGKLQFWLFFVGVNLTFFPLHELGLRGMPRRVFTYLPETGWGPLNFVATIGAFVIGLSALVFVANALLSMRSGELAPADPWEGDTLEWSIPSPPPPYGFATIPTVNSREPLWTRRPGDPVVVGLARRRREILLTSVLEAIPDLRSPHPLPTISPLLTAVAIGVLFITGIFTPWGLPIGAALLLPCLASWGAGPTEVDQAEVAEPEVHDDD